MTTEYSDQASHIEKSWRDQLQLELASDYMRQLFSFLDAEKALGKDIYPVAENLFSAFNLTPLEKVRVVILGQDPYHGKNQAHGLSFSVPAGVEVPPSLRNIYKELANDVGIRVPQSGNLQTWAEQGVLLLNSVLTVEAAQAGSHQGKGWECFTDAVVELLNRQRESLVFMLWGKYAHKKGVKIDRNRHLVLQAPHPSPLSAHRGFIGCAHFSKTNDYLEAMAKPVIEWQT